MNEPLIRAQVAVTAACARATLRAAGMQAMNMECMIKHKPLVYLEADFERVITEEGIGYNDIHSLIFTR